MVHCYTVVASPRSSWGGGYFLQNDRVLYLAYFDSGYVFDRIQLECSYCGTHIEDIVDVPFFLSSSRDWETGWWLLCAIEAKKRHSGIRKLVCFDGSLHNLETVKNERLTDPSWRSSGDQSGLEERRASSLPSSPYLLYQVVQIMVLKTIAQVMPPS